MTTLVTGFDPFGGMRTNPSQAAGSWLATHRDDCAYVPVPTSYAGSIRALDQAVRTHNPTALLLLGFAESAVGLRLERCARNITNASAPDNDGKHQSGPIQPEAPDRIETRFGYDGLLNVLAGKGIVHTASDDAGGYVCNWLYWHALVTQPSLPTLFVHLGEPESEASWNTTCAGLQLVAEAVSARAEVSTRRAASRP